MTNLEIFKAKIGAAESQRYEPGINQFDNCGPAAVSAIMQVYGYPDLEPQDLVGAGYRGGTTAEQLQNMLTKYKNPPSTVIANLIVTKLPCISLFKSNAAAQLINYNDGIYHWCVPLDNDGQTIVIWNPEWGVYEKYTHEFIYNSFAGTSVVFNRPFGGIVDAREFRFIVAMLTHVAATGRTPDNQKHLEAMANSLKDDLTANDAGVTGSSWVLAALGGFNKQVSQQGQAALKSGTEFTATIK